MFGSISRNHSSRMWSSALSGQDQLILRKLEALALAFCSINLSVGICCVGELWAAYMYLASWTCVITYTQTLHVHLEPQGQCLQNHIRLIDLTHHPSCLQTPSPGSCTVKLKLSAWCVSMRTLSASIISVRAAHASTRPSTILCASTTASGLYSAKPYQESAVQCSLRLHPAVCAERLALNPAF